MKLTIIAATGGVGRELLEQAVAAGHDVTAVVRNPGKLSRQVRTVTADMAAADPAALEPAVAAADAVPPSHRILTPPGVIMPRIPARTTESVPHAASKLTEFTSSPQPAVPPAPPAPRPRRGGTPAGRFVGHAQDDAGVSRRAAYAAFGWVLAFLAWHVVWAGTGLWFSHHYHGAAQMLMWGVDAIMVVMWAVGIPLPLALARPWGRRVPRWMLLWAAWTGCALLGARGIAGVADDVARAIGFSRGLTGMTTAQVTGTGHPSAWMSFAGTATDVLFVAGGLMFGLAALTYQRAFPRRRSSRAAQTLVLFMTSVMIAVMLVAPQPATAVSSELLALAVLAAAALFILDQHACARDRRRRPRSSSPIHSRRPTPERWIDKERARLTKAIEDAERGEQE